MPIPYGHPEPSALESALRIIGFCFGALLGIVSTFRKR